MLAALLLLATSQLPPADRCQAVVPAALASRLEAEHPGHRMPRGDDATCQMEKPRECLLAVSGDFNGDGKPDYAVVMPSRSGAEAPLLLTGVAADDGWKIHQFSIGTSTITRHLLLSILPPRAYRETPSVLPTGVTGRALTSEHDGVMLVECESWATGYFLIGRHWFSMALSD